VNARRTFLLALSALAAAGLVTPAGASRALHGGAGVVSLRGTIGALHLDRSTAADVRRVAGRPDYEGIGSFRPGVDVVPLFRALGYDCHQVKSGGILINRRDRQGYPQGSGVECKTTYYVSQRTHTLGYFETASRAFHTPLGTHVGLAWAKVKEHGHYPPNCGGPLTTGRDATLGIWNRGGKTGPKRPGDEPDERNPVVGGWVSGLDLESNRHPLTFFCW
jgi:hypothetical protein